MRRTKTGESITGYLQRASLPVAEARGNEIDPDDLNEYIIALINNRLDAEPRILKHAAALRQGSAIVPQELADEFEYLGGTDRLEKLVGQIWDELDDDVRRLIVLTLFDTIGTNPDGATVAERVQVDWRF